MCVILALETQKELDSLTLEILKSAELTNPDGNGYATLINGRVIFEKGISMKSIWEKIQSGKIISPCIIHARITSMGKTTPELCHPFIINEDSQNNMKGILKDNETAVFHNGTMSDYKDLVLQTALGAGRKLPTGLMSDTRGIAYCLYSLGVEALEYIDTGFNKFATLNSKGLKKYGHWVNVNGIESSNNYYANVSTMKNICYGFGYDEFNDEDTIKYKTDKDAFEYHITPEYDPYKAQKYEKTIYDLDKEKVKSLKSKIVKISKKEHKLNVKFLKNHGWKRAKDLTRKECQTQVDLIQQNKINIDKVKNKKSKVLKMNLDNYSSIYDKQNDEWIKYCRENEKF